MPPSAHSRRLRRHRDHQLHGLPAGQLQLALHQPAHRRIRRLGREPRPLHARTDRRDQAGHAGQSADRAPQRRRADGQVGRQHPGRVLRADAAGRRLRRGHDLGHRRLAGSARVLVRPRRRAGLLELPLRKAKKMFPNVLVAFGNRLPDPAHGQRLRPRRGLRLLGSLPSAAGRPGDDPQGRRGPHGRSAPLHRLAQLPVAPVPRPALHLHHEPDAGPRSRARVPRHRGDREEARDGDRRRPGRHGVRDHRRASAATA
jgi:hypothetical protein